jgi:hypothetical protein
MHESITKTCHIGKMGDLGKATSNTPVNIGFNGVGKDDVGFRASEKAKVLAKKNKVSKWI